MKIIFIQISKKKKKLVKYPTLVCYWCPLSSHFSPWRLLTLHTLCPAGPSAPLPSLTGACTEVWRTLTFFAALHTDWLYPTREYNAVKILASTLSLISLNFYST